jgi:glyoxylase-like metal-dependent hydrolase (beta-lactamase superfamily II)
MTLKPLFAAAALTLTTSLVHAGQLHVFTSDAAGFNTHSVWYDDGKEVTVVDTQFVPQIAQKLVADIQRQTKSPITRIIVTHPSPDKFNALSVFHQLGAESISSAKTAQAIAGVDAYKRYFWVNIAKAFTDETYPKVEPVKTTFSGKQQIKLKSGETISLFELKHAGIASNQVVVRIDQTGDLIVGDLVHSNNHAWLEGGIVDGKTSPDLTSWKAALNELPALTKASSKVYGGRGAVLPVKQAVAQQIAYLDKAEQIVDTYIAGLGDKRSEFSDPAKQGAHYAAIQAEFVKAYPSYAMPDLISYSVYGLVQKKIAAK